jgi:hypothetical protein
MGTSSSPAELVGKLGRLAGAVQKSNVEGVKSGAAATKQIIIANAASRGVSPGSKIAGAAWSVGYDVKGTYRPTALVRIRGQFHLVESDTKLHIIAARRLATRGALRGRTGEIALSGGGVSFGKLRAAQTRRRAGAVVQTGGKRALVIGGNPRAYAVHRGTKGKGIFAASKTQAERVVPPIIRSRIRLAMTEVIR